MSSRPDVPLGPLLGGSDNLESLTVQTLRSINFVGSVGFFGVESADQQDGPATQNDIGEIDQSSDHDAIVSLTNSLRTYGLTNHAPIFTGRTITFTNNTSDSTLELYVTVGAKGNTLTKIHSFTGTGSANAFVYSIPDEIGWSGNFQAWPVGELPTNQLGASIFELSANDQTKTAGVLNPLRDNWDISTVPPNVPDPQLDCGPRAQCVAASYTKITSPGSGYFTGYNLTTVNNGTGLITGFAVTNPGTGYNDGSIYNTSGGHGTGLKVVVNTASPPGTPAPITAVGLSGPAPVGYKDGDVVTIVGGGNDATTTLTVNESGTGSGLIVDLLSVNGGSLMYPICETSWKPSTPGQGGYVIRDFGSGYSEFDRLTVVQNTAIKSISGGDGYSTATGVTTSGGTGTGLTVDILAVAESGGNTGVIAQASVSAVGTGYVVGDTITVDGGTNPGSASFTITSVTPAVDGVLTIGDLTEKQSKSYNVGWQVTPPAPPTDTTTYPPLQPTGGGYWPPVVTTCVDSDGNCPEAITWPNDTVLPKSQTGYAQGNYEVSLVDPIVNFP